MPSLQSAAAGIFLTGLLFGSPIPILKHTLSPEYFLYVASNSVNGLYAYKFTPADQAFSKLPSLDPPAHVVALIRHPSNKFLYSISTGNLLSGFAIHRGTGALRLLSKVQAKGDGACSLLPDRKGWMLIVANCGSGNVEAFRVDGDGGIGDSTGLQQHGGANARPRGIAITPDNFYLFVTGFDQVFQYRFDPARAIFWPNSPAAAPLKPGSGPRALVFRPDEKFAYAIDEPGSSVGVLAYNRGAGTVKLVDSIATVPGHPAALEIDSSGRFLYVSNLTADRTDDSVSVFAIDGKKGVLKSLQRVPAQGKNPGYLQIDPTGHLLLVANRDSNQVVLFEIDRKTGSLRFTGKTIDVPSPSCFQLVPASGPEIH